MRYYRCLAFAVVLWPVWPVSLEAQTVQPKRPGRSSSGSAYARYAQRITTVADSAVLLLNSSLAGSPSPAADNLASLLAATSRRVSGWLGDFDAITPPTDLQRLHEQLVTPLRTMADKFARGAALSKADCSVEHAAGLACDEARSRLVNDRTVVAIIGSIPADVQEYQDARRRAQQMLAQHRVTLPDLP